MSLEQYHSFSCPYCGGNNTLEVDLSGGSFQDPVFDCEVCCSPILAEIKLCDAAIESVRIRKENG